MIRTRRVGGIRFLFIGRLTLSWSVSRKAPPGARRRGAPRPTDALMAEMALTRRSNRMNRAAVRLGDGARVVASERLL